MAESSSEEVYDYDLPDFPEDVEIDYDGTGATANVPGLYLVEWQWSNTAQALLAGFAFSALFHLMIFVLIPRLAKRFKLFNAVLSAAAIAQTAICIDLVRHSFETARLTHPDLNQSTLNEMTSVSMTTTVLLMMNEAALPLRVIAQLLRVRTVLMTSKPKSFILMLIAVVSLGGAGLVVLSPIILHTELADTNVGWAVMLTLTGSQRLIAISADIFFVHKFSRYRKQAVTTPPSYPLTSRSAPSPLTATPVTPLLKPPAPKKVQVGSSKLRIYFSLVLQIFSELVQMVWVVMWAIELLSPDIILPDLMEESFGVLAFVWSLYAVTLVNDEVARLCRRQAGRSRSAEAPGMKTTPLNHLRFRRKL